MAFLKYILIISVFFLIGFGCAKELPSEKVAIAINAYTLTMEEFNELFAKSGVDEDTPQTRETFLENLITRKLLLQEAQREGLDKRKDFLESIENFWEQSLLKIVVDRKTKKISRDITLTEQEVEDYYNKWAQQNPENTKTFEELRETIKWQALKEKQSLIIDSWIERLRDNANIKIDKKAIGIEK